MYLACQIQYSLSSHIPCNCTNYIHHKNPSNAKGIPSILSGISPWWSYPTGVFPNRHAQRSCKAAGIWTAYQGAFAYLGQYTEILERGLLIFGFWNFVFTWRKPVLIFHIQISKRTAKELTRKLQLRAVTDFKWPWVSLFWSNSSVCWAVWLQTRVFWEEPGTGDHHSSPETKHEALTISSIRW